MTTAPRTSGHNWEIGSQKPTSAPKQGDGNFKLVPSPSLLSGDHLTHAHQTDSPRRENKQREEKMPIAVSSGFSIPLL